MRKIYPTDFNVLIKVVKIEEGEKIKNGLIIPNKNQRVEKRMIVEALGPNVPNYSIGSEVLFLKGDFTHNYFEDDQEYWLIPNHSITAVIVDDVLREEIPNAGC